VLELLEIKLMDSDLFEGVLNLFYSISLSPSFNRILKCDCIPIVLCDKNAAVADIGTQSCTSQFKFSLLSANCLSLMYFSQ